MALKPHVTLLPGWVDETTPNPGGVQAYFRNPTRCGPLQISWLQHTGGAPVSEESVLEASIRFGEQQFGCGPAIEKATGSCVLGFYGTAKFSLPPDRCFGQVWVLSNGAGFFVLATYMSAKEPELIEVSQAHDIVCRITLIEPSCSSARVQDVPKGEAAFTEYVAAQLRRELEGAQVQVKGPLTLVVGGGLQLNLGRIFTYCSDNADGCRSEILAYVKGVAQLHNGHLPPPSRDAVRIIVRTSAYVRASSPQTTEMQWRPLVDELVMLPAIDAPQAILPLSEKNNGELGLSADEVFNLGLANLRARLKPLMQVAKVVQPGQIGYIEGDVYHSSRLALHESWSLLATAQGGKLIVATPENDTVLYVAEDTPAAIKALRTLTQNVMSRSPRPLSSELLHWTPQRWEVVR